MNVFSARLNCYPKIAGGPSIEQQGPILEIYQQQSLIMHDLRWNMCVIKDCLYGGGYQWNSVIHVNCLSSSEPYRKSVPRCVPVFFLKQQQKEVRASVNLEFE